MHQDPQPDELPVHARRTGSRRLRGEYRNLTARVLLVPGMGAVITGMVIEHGVLMVTGLILTGLVGHLATPRRGDDPAQPDERPGSPDPPCSRPPRS